MSLKEEWKSFFRAILAPQFIIHVILTAGLYIGATFIVISWARLSMYALVTLPAGLAGAEFLKRFRKTQSPMQVRNSYSASLLDIVLKEKSQKKNGDIVASTLKLIKKSLTE